MASPPNLAEYLTVKLATEFLEVSPSTLRSWGRGSKLRPHRHPKNRDWLDRRAELEAALGSAARSG